MKTIAVYEGQKLASLRMTESVTGPVRSGSGKSAQKSTVVLPKPDLSALRNDNSLGNLQITPLQRVAHTMIEAAFSVHWVQAIFSSRFGQGEHPAF
jgi:hypothetical protein